MVVVCLLFKLKLNDNEQYWNLNTTVHASEVKPLASQPLEAEHYLCSDMRGKKVMQSNKECELKSYLPLCKGVKRYQIFRLAIISTTEHNDCFHIMNV
jgi:hypothetical protein